MLDKNSTDINAKTAGKYHPSQSLLVFLETEYKLVEDFYKNLSTKYDDTAYKSFEDRFIQLRNKFKGKLNDISDPDHEFLNHAESRKTSVEKILTNATATARKFQEARDNKRLDRPGATDSLENLLYAIKNLMHLIKEQSKI